MKTLQKIVSIFFYSLGGVVLYAANTLAGIDFSKDKSGQNLAATAHETQQVLVIIILVGVGLFLLGGLVRLFRGFKKGAGISLVSAGSMSLFATLTMLCLIYSPEMTKSFPPGFPEIFGNYIKSAALAGCELLIGIGLLISAKKPA